MRRPTSLCAVVLLTAWSVVSCSASVRPLQGGGTRAGDYDGTVQTRDGRSRAYRVHLPRGWDGVRPLPVVLAFHGAGGNGSKNEEMMRWVPVADRHQFAVIEPEGVRPFPPVPAGVWNAGGCCAKASDDDIDDVGFVGQMLDEVSASFPVDKARIFATGFSNGASLAHRLACQLSDRIAAIAPVSGVLLDVEADTHRRRFTCAPSRNVPILEIHGRLDRVILYEGGKSRCLLGAPAMPSVESTITGWARRNGCGPEAKVVLSRGATTCISFEGCAEETTLCTVSDLGHAWAGGEPAWFPCMSPWSNSLDTTQTIWLFFERHSLSTGRDRSRSPAWSNE